MYVRAREKETEIEKVWWKARVGNMQMAVSIKPFLPLTVTGKKFLVNIQLHIIPLDHVQTAHA